MKKLRADLSRTFVGHWTLLGDVRTLLSGGQSAIQTPSIHAAAALKG